MRTIPLLFCCALLSGCNLVRGIGQDMTAVGRTLSKISGTDTGERQEDAAPAPQTFDQSYSYEDQNYVAPLEQAP